MFGSSQDQNVGNGSTAIQASGNVTYGMTYSEVNDLCKLLHEKNFPILRAEAQAIADERVRLFAEGLGQQIVNAARKIDAEKFKDPDVQACLHDAVASAARRGEDSNPETLCRLVIERISNQSNSFKDIVISEAIQVVPKLTQQHISTLCITHVVQSMYFGTIVSLSQLELVAAELAPLIQNCIELSETQKRHMQYSGACAYNPLQIIDPYERMFNSYKSIGFRTIDAFRSALIIEAPTFSEMTRMYGAQKLYSINLTSVGQAIALATIAKHIQLDLDFSIWLK